MILSYHIAYAFINSLYYYVIAAITSYSIPCYISIASIVSMSMYSIGSLVVTCGLATISICYAYILVIVISAYTPISRVLDCYWHVQVG